MGNNLYLLFIRRLVSSYVSLSCRRYEVKTIVLASLKGGSGKSTITVNLAVEATGTVATVDMDSPQGSLSHWWNARKAETPIFVDYLTPKGIDYLFVDTPPQRPDPDTIKAADLVIIPVKPSPNDLRAIGETLAVVERLQKPFCFAINMVKPRTRITMNALQVLAQYGKVAPVMLGDRVDFAESMIDGLAVGELAPQSKSADEVTQLWTYVSSLLWKD
jgi:chromosome partitioning protein